MYYIFGMGRKILAEIYDTEEEEMHSRIMKRTYFGIIGSEK